MHKEGDFLGNAECEGRDKPKKKPLPEWKRPISM
jgi:hypothetical protein